MEGRPFARPANATRRQVIKPHDHDGNPVCDLNLEELTRTEEAETAAQPNGVRIPPIVADEGSSAVYSCVHGDNADLIATVVALHVKPNDRILDTTFGKGGFWRKCHLSKTELVTCDLERPADYQCDFRDLPFPDEEFDHTVFDPPYMHDGRTVIVRGQYNNGLTTGTMNHNKVIGMYGDGMKECARVTKDGGMLWVKCQDEIESGCQRLSHLEVYAVGVRLGLYARDLFVLHQKGRPILQNRHQKHARKNHSYLLIFEKGAAAKLASQTALIQDIWCVPQGAAECNAVSFAA